MSKSENVIDARGKNLYVAKRSTAQESNKGLKGDNMATKPKKSFSKNAAADWMDNTYTGQAYKTITGTKSPQRSTLDKTDKEISKITDKNWKKYNKK